MSFRRKYSRDKNTLVLFDAILGNVIFQCKGKKDAEIHSGRITVDTRECPFIDVNDFILFFCHREKHHFNVSGLLQVYLTAISLFCYYLFVQNTRNVSILN